jgi:hypothetical protein
MKGGGIITIVAIGGAAYLAYQYLKTQGMLGGEPAVAVEAETEKPAVEEVAKPADFAALTRDQLYQYALANQGAGWDGRLTVSQWNWMTSRITGVEQQATLPGGSDPIYAEDYLALRKTAGLSGMGYLMPVGWA